jgi:hypothetical protein
MSASTAPAVKAQLLTLLRADPGYAGVLVEYGLPATSSNPEVVFFTRTIQTERPDSIGQRKQRESYDIETVVGAKVDGDNPQAAEERCWALVAVLENIVRANNSNTGALSAALTPSVGWVVMGAIEMTPYVEQGARYAEALCKVHVEAIK